MNIVCRYSVAVFSIVVLFSVCCAQTAGTPTPQSENSIKQAVTDSERRWEEGLERFDPKAMQSLLAEDDLQTDFRGVVQDKISWIEAFKQAAANVRSGESQWAISFDDEKVRVYGDAAIVTGQGTFKGHRKGGAPVNRVLRFTNVWVKRQGAWQLVNYQATPIELQ